MIEINGERSRGRYMREVVVTRHEGVKAWLREKKGLMNAEIVEHFSTEDIRRLREGDRVVGILPMNLAKEVRDRGAQFDLIVMPELTREQRGVELTPDEMDAAGAKLMRVTALELEEV